MLTIHQRTASSLEEGGDPEVDEELCPRNKTCQYAYLTCTEAGTLHTEDCYQMIETGMKHVGGLNSHVCTDACGKTTSKVLVCDNPHHHLPSKPWDYKSALNHYEFGNSRCYSPCEDEYKTQQPQRSVTRFWTSSF